MKKVIALLTACTMLFTGCDLQNTTDNTSTPYSNVVQEAEQDTSSESVLDMNLNQNETATEEITFSSLNDEDLLQYMEDSIYFDLVTNLNSEEYFVENVEATYISKEYLEEVAFNSQENIYFGYTLSDLQEQFQGTKYVFSVDESGNTIVKAFEAYDDTYEQVVKNVAIGTGVILICVTVSFVSGGAGLPAVSAIFAVSAKSGAILATSNGIVSGVAAGIVTGVQTKEFEKAMDAAALSGSEGFKWGAVTGVVAGGAGEASALHGATLKGLTMNQAAVIQKESKYPVSVIKQFKSAQEYEAYKNAGLTVDMVNGKTALIQQIDLDLSDKNGYSNLMRMKEGMPPLDATGTSYELHHIGQEADSPLAILTKLQHDSKGLHTNAASKINRNEFEKIKKNFWKAMAVKAS